MPMRLSISRSDFALAASFVAGVIIFAAMVPLMEIWFSGVNTFDFEDVMIDAKLKAVARSASPKIVIISGSNALYSIDAGQMSRELQRPVVNAAVHFGLALHMMERVAPLLKAGDTVFLPLEYEQYSLPFTFGEVEACYRLFNFYKAPTWTLAWYLSFLGCSIKSSNLEYAIRRDRYGIVHPTPDPFSVISSVGDRTDNSPDTAKGSGHWNMNPPEAAELSQPRLEEDIRAMQKAGARVVVTFPVQPSDSVWGQVLQEWDDSLKRWTRRVGVELVSNPQDHLFASSCFYDTPYHLHSGCRPRNTEIYVEALRAARLN
jgi:hypothetical protein